MRLRVLFITALLVGGFLLITSKTDWGQQSDHSTRVSKRRPALVRARRGAQRRPDVPMR